jgi:hypothetical protein
MARFSEFISYFETLAREHKSILHSDAEKHFFRMELDEVLAGINRTDVNFPILALEGYAFGFNDYRSDNILKNREGAFMLIDHVSDPSDYEAVHEIWDELESIATEIIRRIRKDKAGKKIAVVRDFNVESVRGTLIMNEIGNQVGIRLTYSTSSSENTDTDPTAWTSESE